MLKGRREKERKKNGHSNALQNQCITQGGAHTQPSGAWAAARPARGGGAGGPGPARSLRRSSQAPSFLSKFFQKKACFLQIFANISLVVLFVFIGLREEKNLFRARRFFQTFRRRLAAPALPRSLHPSTNSDYQEGLLSNSAGQPRRKNSIACLRR